MSLALTFGSFGDILALTGLVIKAVHSLSDCAGAASQCKDLIAELDETSSILELVHSRFTSQHRPRKDVLNAIGFQVSGCRSAIETFKGNVKGYERSEGLQGAWRKITWIFKSDDVAALRAKLMAHRGAIAIFLSLSISCVQLLLMRKCSRQVSPVSPAAIKLTARARWDTRLKTQFSWWMH